MRNIFLCTALILALSACDGGSAREALGFERKSPDEFKVVARPPLSVPPEFNLRPPAVGESPLGATPAHEDAKALVLGREHKTLPANDPLSVQSSSLESKGEAAFLSKVGAGQTDPSIRARLEEETTVNEDEQSMFERLQASGKSGDPVVKADAEAQRLKKNEEEGKDPTDGETPTIKPKDRGWLGKVF